MLNFSRIFLTSEGNGRPSLVDPLPWRVMPSVQWSVVHVFPERADCVVYVSCMDVLFCKYKCDSLVLLVLVRCSLVVHIKCCVTKDVNRQ